MTLENDVLFRVPVYAESKDDLYRQTEQIEQQLLDE